MADMREIKIEKVTLNICTGKPGLDLEKATRLLEQISGKKATQTKTKKRIPTWGLRPGLVIGTKVTIRGPEAEKLLTRLFSAVENKLKPRKVDNNGNLSFGIKEYIDIPEAKYDIDIGIIGLDVAVTLKRAGFRIKNRFLKTKKLGTKHKITKEDSLNYFTTKFNVNFGEE